MADFPAATGAKFTRATDFLSCWFTANYQPVSGVVQECEKAALCLYIRLMNTEHKHQLGENQRELREEERLLNDDVVTQRLDQSHIFQT